MAKNIEEYRDYCLSLGADVEEKLPFTAFRYASNVLVFYVCGHMFAFLDIDHYGIVTLKCQPERIDEIIVVYLKYLLYLCTRFNIYVWSKTA